MCQRAVGIEEINCVSLSKGVCLSRTHLCLLLLHFPHRRLQKNNLRLLLLLQLFLQTTLLVLLLHLFYLQIEQLLIPLL